MSKETTILVLGLAVMVIPFTGFPDSFRTFLLFACGGAIAAIGFLLRGRISVRRISHTTNNPFIENRGMPRHAAPHVPGHEEEAAVRIQ